MTDPLESGVRNLIIITGPMRSGTAAMGEAIHRLGIPVAVTMGAPSAPDWRFDWEDITAMRFLGSLIGRADVAQDERDAFAGWFADRYLPFRLEAAMAIGRMSGVRTDTIAVKSPLLMPFIMQAVELAARRFAITTKVILMERFAAESDASLARIYGAHPPMLEMMERTQTMLRSCVLRTCDLADYIVQYSGLVEEPALVLGNTCEVLGLGFSREQVAHAAKFIVKGGIPCQSSPASPRP